jgi:RNA polymerase sigma-70 factor (ECF subfamily)
MVIPAEPCFFGFMDVRAELETLISRVALGDRAAFSALYDATSAKLFGTCLRVLKVRAEAEEVLQEVFVTIWQKADRYQVTGHSPMTWLITLARNRAIDRLRARKPHTELDDAMPLADATPGPEARAVAAGEARRVVACLDELKEDRAQAVRGAYLDGKSYAELAERHAVPLNTMRTWLRRSLQQLKECLSQ